MLKFVTINVDSATLLTQQPAYQDGMVWFNHSFLRLKSRNNTNAARGNTIKSKITNCLCGDEKNI